MGSYENLTETEADRSVRVATDTVVNEDFVNLFDTVGDGGCVSGVVDANGGCENTSVELRKGSTASEYPANCLSGNSCHSYGCGDTMDQPNGYQPPFGTYLVDDGIDFTNSENFREMDRTDGVNGVSYGPEGQIEKKEFGVSGLCSTDSDIENQLINDNGLENPSPDGESLSTSPGCSGITYILPNEQKETGLTGSSSRTYTTDCLDDPYLDSSQGDDEEKVHGSSGISSDLPMGENIDGLTKGSPEIASYNLAEGLVTPLSLFFGVADISCSKYPSVSDCRERCGVNALTCCSSSKGGSSGLTSNDGWNNFECNTMFEANNVDVVPSSSSMAARVSKSNRLTRTRRAARQCKQTATSSSGLGNTLGATLNKIRGKRSNFCKPARLNIWGELGSLVQIFDQNASMPEFTIRNSCHEVGLLGRESKVVKNRGSVKRSGVRRRRCQKTEVGGTFKRLDRSTSTNRQRSKVKMEGHRGRKGKQSLFPKVDSLDGVGLKPSDVQSLFSVLENPNLAAVGSTSNSEVKCIHTGIKSWVCEPDCQHNLEVPEPVRELAHKLEADGCGSEHLDQLVVFRPAEEFKLPLDGNSGRPIMSRNVSVLDSQHGDKDMESTVTVDVLTEYTSGDCQGVSPPVEIEVSKEAIVNKHLELGLFPALEGFNLIPEKAAIMCEVTVSTGQKSRAKKGKKNEKVKGDLYISAGSFRVEQKMLDPVSLNKASKLVKSRTVKNVRNKNGPKAAFNSAGSTSDSGKSPGLGGFSVETSPSDITEVKVTREIVKAETGMEAAALSGQCPFGITQSAAPMLEGLLPISKRKGKGSTLPKKSTVASRKSRSHVSDLTKSRKGNARGKKENTHNTLRASKMEEKGVLHESCCKDRTRTHNISSCFETGMCSELRKFTELSENNLVAKDAQQEIGGLNGSKEVASRDMSGSVMVTVGDDLAPSKSSEGLEVQCFPPRVAWVLCDDCQKWRCIPAELADIIEETDSKWTCKDNTDMAFADCSIPQEKSNAEINAELNISDEDSCSVQRYFKGSEFKQSTASQQASWTLIKSNLFLHRSRRTQTIDEIMVCQCKPPLDGSMGCGDECLNRILNIECVQGTCPCGDLCSNQQFQRQKYADFKWFRCGKKGYGLQLQEDISQGAFLIEYVGEVLDLHAYEARQQDYASKGQRHFYFMTLNGSEVIDACVKGNLGRFINHSCDPNCRTEKWMVNGEVCIGLFALRNIKKGEEVTFDYNYVRVFGAAAKKCVCGSPECRGYIGGDPSNTEVVQVDSDDDFPESIMIHEDGRMERFVEDKILDNSLLDPVAVPQGDHLEETKILDSRLPDVALSQEEHLEEEAIPDTSLPDAVTIPQEEHFRVERIPNTRLSDVFPVPHGEVSLQTTQIKSQPSSDSVEVNLKISKQCSSRTKSPCIASSIKKGRCINSKIKSTKPKKLIAGSESSRSSDRVDAKLNEIKSTKPKKMIAGAESSRIEGVEEKLNEVLDAEGGISKRKDATKGYLKLLLVTAASGDNIKGEAFQSTRDLSIVLDALLKTKSRMVLVDIVNKNGLQMLHNMIKQNRRNFNKTPIIRKLLKVLEFLAVKEILTLEQINAGPPCAGMESFRDSIFILARHSDTQVQRIARSFRDKWMPRTFRKVNNLDREDAKFSHGRGHWKEFSAVSQKHRQGLSACHDAINCTAQKIPNTTMLDNENPTSLTSPSPMLLANAATSTTDRDPTTVSKQRKRKSRWDQPTEMATGAETQPQQNTKRLIIETNSNLQHCSPSQVEPSLWVPEVSEISQNQIMDCSDRQPYFPNPTCSEVVMGQPQVKFLSNLPVSYGIPLPLVQQLGTYHQEEAGGDGCSSPGWEIAPAVPFHPFPPLPPFPPPSQPSANNHTMLPSQRKYSEEAQADNCSRNHHMESTTPIVSGTTASEAVSLNRTRSLRSHEREKWSSGSLGRRYFRHQKWNSQGHLKTRPWVRQHSSCASKGNWKHGGFSCVENVTNEMGSMGRGEHSDRRTTGGAGLCPLEDLGGRNVSDKYYHQNPPSHH